MDIIIEDFKKYVRYERQLSAQTVTHYIDILKMFDEFITGLDGKNMLNINREDIGRYMAHLKDQGLSRSSILNYITVLRTFYKWAAYTKGTESILQVNFFLTNIVKIRKDTKMPYVPSREDVEKIRNTLKEYTTLMGYDRENYTYKKAIFAYAVIELLISTGMRSGEIRTIKMKDVNLEQRTVFIRMGKGSCQRVSLFGDSAVNVLKEYFLSRKFLPDDLIFPIRQSNSLNYLIKRWAIRSKTDGRLHTHSIRHFFITESRKRGVPQDVVASQVGHKSTATTNLYTHYDLDDIKVKYQGINI